MHLGMSGRFLVTQGRHGRASPGEFHHEHGGARRHDHVVFQPLERRARHLQRRPPLRLDGPRAPRRARDLAAFRRLGLEPLGNELSGEAIARLFQGKRTPLKAALLDQRLIAGLGNIYVCEALFRAGLHPEAAGGLARDGKRASRRERPHRLAEAIRDVLDEAIEAGGSSLRDHAQADGALGYFQHRFRVYDREGEPCATRGCGGTVRRIVQSGRSTFYCPRLPAAPIACCPDRLRFG